eukprot:4751213-Pyramimonas_sp.AAC.2
MGVPLKRALFGPAAPLLVLMALHCSIDLVLAAEASTFVQKAETFLSKAEKKGEALISELLHYGSSPETGGAEASSDSDDSGKAAGEAMLCVARDTEDGSCIYLPGPGSKVDRRSMRGEFLGPIGYESSEKYMTPKCAAPAELHNFPPDYQYLIYNTTDVPVPQIPGAEATEAAEESIGDADSPAQSNRVFGMFGRKLLGRKPPPKSRQQAHKTSKRRKKRPVRGGADSKMTSPIRTLQTPKEKDFAFFEAAAKNMAGYCPFKVKECAVPGMKEGVLQFRKGPGNPCCTNQVNTCCRIKAPFPTVLNHTLSRADWDRFPSIPKGHWGSCALVALGNNMIHNPRGDQIDHHDVVIRLGHAPVAEFSKYVGSRTDVVLSRGVGSRMRADMAHKDAKFYIGANAGTGLPTLQGYEIDKPPVDFADLTGPGMSPRHLSGTIYASMTQPLAGKPRGPTTGFILALRQVYSNFCSRLDLFGFSADGGPGYYSDAAQPMKLHHAAELESWSFHHLMKEYPELNMCVYL